MESFPFDNESDIWEFLFICEFPDIFEQFILAAYLEIEFRAGISVQNIHVFQVVLPVTP